MTPEMIYWCGVPFGVALVMISSMMSRRGRHLSEAGEALRLTVSMIAAQLSTSPDETRAEFARARAMERRGARLTIGGLILGGFGVGLSTGVLIFGLVWRWF